MKINPSRFQSPSLPVEGITWQEAMDFCGKLNLDKEKFKVPEGMVFRLPSEAEWEYAARAGSKTTFFFGDNSKPLHSMPGFLIIRRTRPNQSVC
jgi:formylglycine-generating enzyme required for sulfatase activity